MKILFLVPYPIGQSPSQRFRFEQYFAFLSQKGIEHKVKSFLEPDNWKVFYKRGSVFLKATAIIGGFAKRFILFSEITDYDFVFIHREVAPIGPPVFEWIIAKVFRKKIIYDFDDAIWLTDKKESWIEKAVRWRGKVTSVCRWSYRVSAGNIYLADYAKQFNEKVIVNPTTVDTEKVSNKNLHRFHEDGRIVIGWTGSHSTLKYLKDVEQVLQHIEEKYPMVSFCVIADKTSDLQLDRLVFKPWSVDTEVSNLAEIDIGIMPLPNDEWTKGKCGFKALQYMAMEKPTVASAVGVNTSIISNGVNGLIAKDIDDWEKLLSSLIEDESLRKDLGKEGRKTVERNYSILSNTKTFLSLFE